MSMGIVHGRAFTLIELMIVVAIIAILTTVAIPNLLRSRMAANETDAIAACKGFATAEDIYHRTDWDKDGVLEYATTMSGPTGLFTRNPANPGDVGLVDLAFANAVGDPGTAIPKTGYVFRVLTGQSANAPGGSKSYIARGNMTNGYGLSVIPVAWDATGRNCFQINNSGTIFQKDRGSTDTAHLTVFDPGAGWVVTK